MAKVTRKSFLTSDGKLLGKETIFGDLAKPRNEEEKKFIESSKKKGFIVTRDPTGELNALSNFGPGWNAYRSWKRRHSGEPA